MAALAAGEREALLAALPDLQRRLLLRLLPKDDADSRSAVLEVRVITVAHAESCSSALSLPTADVVTVDARSQEPVSSASLLSHSLALCVTRRYPRSSMVCLSSRCALQVRAGTGGDEAALFAMDLFRMYQRHVAARGWRWEQLSLLETEVGPQMPHSNVRARHNCWYTTASNVPIINVTASSSRHQAALGARQLETATAHKPVANVADGNSVRTRHTSEHSWQVVTCRWAAARRAAPP